jgi:hypothetical protein
VLLARENVTGINSVITVMKVPVDNNTCTHTLREEHSFRMFENRVLKRIFAPKRKEVAGGWRILHNEELQSFYVSPNTIMVIKLKMRCTGHVACTKQVKNAYKILVGEPEGKRQLGRPGRMW